MKEKKKALEFTYISVGVILGIFLSLLFALIFGVIGVVFLSILCICALILYVLNQLSNDQETGIKSGKTQKKESEWFVKLFFKIPHLFIFLFTHN